VWTEWDTADTDAPEAHWVLLACGESSLRPTASRHGGACRYESDGERIQLILNPSVDKVKEGPQHCWRYNPWSLGRRCPGVNVFAAPPRKIS
jgi:hypothetical protein